MELYAFAYTSTVVGKVILQVTTSTVLPIARPWDVNNSSTKQLLLRMQGLLDAALHPEWAPGRASLVQSVLLPWEQGVSLPLCLQLKEPARCSQHRVEDTVLEGL